MSASAELSSPKLSRYKHLDYKIPEKTLVWQLTGKGLENFHLAEIPLPDMGPTDILFRSDSNGICFSDVKVVSAGGDHRRAAVCDRSRSRYRTGNRRCAAVRRVLPRAA